MVFLTFLDSTFSNNVARAGAGIYLSSIPNTSAVTFQNLLFQNNQAFARGAAWYSESPIILPNDSTVTYHNNTAPGARDCGSGPARLKINNTWDNPSLLSGQVLGKIVVGAYDAFGQLVYLDELDEALILEVGVGEGAVVTGKTSTLLLKGMSSFIGNVRDNLGAVQCVG